MLQFHALVSIFSETETSRKHASKKIRKRRVATRILNVDSRAV
jgi:hypothetical protein